MIVGGAIGEHALRSPHGPAITFGQDTVSWIELELLLRKTAAWIESRAPSGTPLALHLPQSPALTLLFLAGVRLGREVQILDTQWPFAICEKLLQVLKPGLIISCDHQFSIENTVSMSARHLLFADFAQLHDTSIPHWPVINPAAIFYAGFTSGSHGLPKAYRRTHRSWISSFDAAAQEFPLGHDDVVLAPGTLTHSLFLFALAYAMHTGAQCALNGAFRPDHVLEAAERFRASVLFAVPAQLGMLAGFGAANGNKSVTSLRRIISSGSKWNNAGRSGLRSIFPNASISEFYGTSETSFITIAHEGEQVPEGCVGRAFAGVTINICDDELHTPSNSTAGRIFVHSSMLFSGYVTPDQQVEHLPDGSICTGDIGYLDEQGRLFLAGRENRKIVTSGKNLYPEEVEHVIERHPAIRAAAVVPIVDSKRGEKLFAIVQLHQGAFVSRAEIIGFARQLLPLYKVPRDFARTDDWPTTRSGKTDFRTLENMVQQNVLERLP